MKVIQGHFKDWERILVECNCGCSMLRIMKNPDNELDEFIYLDIFTNHKRHKKLYQEIALSKEQAIQFYNALGEMIKEGKPNE